MRTSSTFILILLAAAFVTPPSSTAKESESASLTWHHTGSSSLAMAGREAKAKGKRILMGLSGTLT